MNGIYLARLPLSAKVFCTLFLVGIGCGAVQASLAPDMPMTLMGHDQMSGEREITLGEISSAARVWLRTPLLIQTSHTHLFGQTLIAGLLGLIFLFASVREWLKALIVALPFAGTLIDIGGMWLTRFVWSGLASLVVAGGTLFALGYALIAIISLWQLWRGTEARA